MSDEYPLMAFIANEGIAPKGERYDRSALVNDTAGKLYKKTVFGDFIYSSNNLETGSIGLNKYGNASISPVYSIFQPTGLADSDFIGRRFVRKDFINAMVKWRQGVIYGQWRIHENPVCLHFIKVFRMTKYLAKKYGLPMPDYDALRKTYTQVYAEPLLLHDANGRLWSDRYYIAYQLENAGELRYVYLTKHHIHEELISYRQAAKERETENLMPKDVKRIFSKALRIMNAEGTDIWIDEEEFSGMKVKKG